MEVTDEDRSHTARIGQNTGGPCPRAAARSCQQIGNWLQRTDVGILLDRCCGIAVGVQCAHAPFAESVRASPRAKHEVFAGRERTVQVLRQKVFQWAVSRLNLAMRGTPQGGEGGGR